VVALPGAPFLAPWAVLIAAVRRYTMLLVLKTQVDKGVVPVVQGNVIAFPQPYDANMKVLFNSPNNIKEYVRLQLLSPTGDFGPLRARLLALATLECAPRRCCRGCSSFAWATPTPGQWRWRAWTLAPPRWPRWGT
jgi:hypothetical protein